MAPVSFRLWRVVVLLSVVLFSIPLVTHHYLSTYEAGILQHTGHDREDSSELLSQLDLFTPTTADLKMRIQEMMRIKASVSAELRALEARRGRLAAELATLGGRAEALRAEQAVHAASLARLKISVEQARLAQEDAVRRNTPELSPPHEIVADRVPPVRPRLSAAMEAHCKMFSCFDYSRCSLTSGFPVYLYSPDEHPVTAGGEVDGFLKVTLRQTLGYNPHLTSEPARACVYLVLVGEAFAAAGHDHTTLSSKRTDSVTLNETALKALPYWGGNGRNHVLINLSRRQLAAKTSALFDSRSVGQAMLVQSTFTHENFRPGFDIITPPMLGPPGGEVWQEYGSMTPARRKYILSFQGERSTDTVPSETEKFILDYLAKMGNDSKTADAFFLQFNCVPPTDTGNSAASAVGDWSLCGTDNSRRTVLVESTYVLILAPQEQIYASTPLLMTRLYEALRSGAIPVILGGDSVVLPYSEVLDWKRAVLLLPYARITELHFFLRALPDTDLMSFRRQGRFLWEKYLSSVQVNVDTILAIIRTRLNIPAAPASEEVATPLFGESFAPPNPEPQSQYTEPEESLGPIEAPYPSPAYRRNYSVSLTQGYELWNDWGDPFALYPQLPWDPLLPTDAKFVGSEAGFRTVGKGSGGSGKEFSEALGGNSPTEQFTIIILTYERDAVLMAALARLRGLPYLNKVVVVWNGRQPPPPDLRWPDIGAPLVAVRAARNSLNNRFLPYDLVDTEAVLSIDDDAHLRHDEIIFAFRVWRENRDRIVGFPGRYHAWDINYQNGFLYNSNYSCELSMVLTGAAFIHRYYMWAYWRHLPQAVRDKVDELINCEDLAINYLVSHITRKPPVKVTSRWTFHCPGCTMTLSTDKTHHIERHKCMQFFTQVFGYTPLLNTQFRADSVLFKTRIPHDKQKCFKFI